MTTFVWIIAILLVLAGIAGTVLPGLPGAPLVFCGLLLAAWVDHFDKVGVWTLGVLAVITLVSLFVDLLTTMWGPGKLGASNAAIWGAGAGAVVGLFFGWPGLFIGPFVGASLFELVHRRDLLLAGKAGTGAVLGLVLGTAMKLALAFTMVGIFFTAYLV